MKSVKKSMKALLAVQHLGPIGPESTLDDGIKSVDVVATALYSVASSVGMEMTKESLCESLRWTADYLEQMARECRRIAREYPRPEERIQPE
jgi:hypothetical protein